MTSCKMGEGLGGWNFCDTRYKGVGKTDVLVWQWGEGKQGKQTNTQH